jgi:hypothetical protein
MPGSVSRDEVIRRDSPLLVVSVAANHQPKLPPGASDRRALVEGPRSRTMF